MPTKPVVINNSPLVFLWILNLFPLLWELYTDVWIPEAVQEEFLGTDTIARRSSLNGAPWVRTVSLTDPQSASVYGRLDRGEASVLALAKEHDAHLIIIDEKKAREEAKRIGLPVRGTLGVLLDAKKKGLIDAIKPLLDALRDNGMYLEQSLIDDVLQLAGET